MASQSGDSDQAPGSVEEVDRGPAIGDQGLLDAQGLKQTNLVVLRSRCQSSESVGSQGLDHCLELL